MGGVIRLAAAELRPHDGPGELGARPEAGSATQQCLQEGPAHLVAGQRVDERVHGRVEDGECQEPLSLVQDGAAECLTGGVQQQQDEERRPAGDEAAQHDDDSLQQCQRLLRALAVGTGVPTAVGNFTEDELAATRADQRVDAGVKHHDGHEDDAEDGGAEEDVGLVVERQHGGALRHALDAVPAHDGQPAQHCSYHPHRADEQEDAARVAVVVQLHLQHGEVPLNCNGQQAEDGRRERHEHAALSEEPLCGRQLVGVGARQQDVGGVDHTGQQVRQRQVPDEVIHGFVELLGPPDGGEYQDVLKDDEAAHDDEDH